jgi:hypothetical protein
MMSRMKNNKEKLSLIMTSIDENFKYEQQFADNSSMCRDLNYDDIVIIEDDVVKS